MPENDNQQVVRIKRSTYLKLKQRQRIRTVSQIALIVLIVAVLALFVVLNDLGILPLKYLLIIIAALLVVILLCAIPVIRKKASNGSRKLQSAVCIILSAVMIAGCVYIPVQKGKLQKLFTPVPTTGTMNINVYALKTSGITDVQQLAAQTVAIQSNLDTDYQDWAVKVINKEITGQDIGTASYSSIYDAADGLYNGNVKALMLNESYVEILCDNDNYSDFLDKTVLVYQCSQTVQLDYNTSAVTNVTTEPFIMLVAGSDTTNYTNISATAKGRSDVVMLLCVNPKTKQVLTISVPRDSYVALSGNVSHQDKITHASTLGISCLVDTVSYLFGIDVNYFLRINFQSFVTIVDAVGGVTVDNPSYFCMTYKKDKTKNYCFDEGTIELDGEHALGYVRERKYGTLTDFGRNQHQAIVVKALAKKVTSVAVITQIGAILDGLQGTFTTDMGSDDIFALAQMQLNDMADWDVLSYTLGGTTGSADSYLGGPGLSMVFLKSSDVTKATGLIAKLKNGTLTSADVG